MMLQTALFLPGSNARALEKAKNLDVDALILDLEDAVAPPDKAVARQRVQEAFSSPQGRQAFGDRRVLIRLNGVDTPFFEKDCEALRHLSIDGIVLPKIESPQSLASLPLALNAKSLFVMIETPLGVINAGDIAADDRVTGLIAGTNDLTTDLMAYPSADRAELQAALQMIVLAARAYNKLALDGVYNAINDTAGLILESKQGRRLGFDGKCLIHPSQIDPVTEAFKPTPEELADAKALIENYEATESGVATYKGKMIEELHVRRAKALIDSA